MPFGFNVHQICVAVQCDALPFLQALDESDAISIQIFVAGNGPLDVTLYLPTDSRFALAALHRELPLH
jgi:hypothetical protein